MYCSCLYDLSISNYDIVLFKFGSVLIAISRNAICLVLPLVKTGILFVCVLYPHRPPPPPPPPHPTHMVWPLLDLNQNYFCPIPTFFYHKCSTERRKQSKSQKVHVEFKIELSLCHILIKLETYSNQGFCRLSLRCFIGSNYKAIPNMHRSRRELCPLWFF